jgi:hypothetical protein
MKSNKRGPTFRQEGAGPRDGRNQHSYTPPARRKSRKAAADPDADVIAKTEVVQALAALGVDAGWAVVQSKGLGWARGMLLLMMHALRRGTPGYRVARFGKWIVGLVFRGEEDQVKFKTVGYTPRELNSMGAVRWKRVLGLFEHPTR